MNREELCVDLVCEGGGVKGIGLVGAISVLEEHGYKFQNIAGSSAGAIVAALLAAGYNAAELRDILMGLDFNKFKDVSYRLPFLSASLAVLKQRGVYKGEFLLNWIRPLLEAKGVYTFRDLLKEEPDSSPYPFKLQVTASDITSRRMLLLPQDARVLGVEPADLEVAMAVRMSMGIPIFFEPVRMANAGTGREHLIVDGGICSNFPVWIFDGEPRWPTFGLLLVEPDPKQPIADRLPGPDEEDEDDEGGINAVLDYLKSLAATVLESRDRYYMESAEFARTIAIPTLGIGTTQFNLGPARVMELYESGRTAAEKFLSTWSYDGYMAEFGAGSSRGRRTELASRIQSLASQQ